MNETDEYWCIAYSTSPQWVYYVKAMLALVIIPENMVVLLAIVKNWSSLTRQHNLYRYLLSLVAADLLNGVILFIHALYWLFNLVLTGSVNFTGESAQEVLKNLISGVQNASIFASLANATLLNLVLRVSSNRALARAAAITSQSGVWERSHVITWTLIGTIWTVTSVFIFLPLRHHCHINLSQCIDGGNFLVFEGNKLLRRDVVKPPSRISYLQALNSCNISLWFLMLVCNLITGCVRTQVQRTAHVERKPDQRDIVAGDSNFNEGASYY